MYYLQSRYYDPEVCRFINADEYASTGQNFLSYNMFAYCNNNPANCIDKNGNLPIRNTMLISNDGGSGSEVEVGNKIGSIAGIPIYDTYTIRLTTELDMSLFYTHSALSILSKLSAASTCVIGTVACVALAPETGVTAFAAWALLGVLADTGKSIVLTSCDVIEAASNYKNNAIVKYRISIPTTFWDSVSTVFLAFRVLSNEVRGYSV